MGIFDKSKYIVYTGIIEQVFQYTTKMILLAKDVDILFPSPKWPILCRVGR